MMRYASLLACGCVLLSGLTSSAHASQILYMSPQELGDEATIVFRGTVERIESSWNRQHTKIFTRTALIVDEAYKGSAGRTIDVVQLGGVVGTVKVTVDGAPQWQLGEEVLLFVEPAGSSSDYRVSGFSQGKFTITRDRETGAAYVMGSPLEGVTLLGAPSTGVPSRALSDRRVTLEQFINEALSGVRNPEVER